MLHNGSPLGKPAPVSANMPMPDKTFNLTLGNRFAIVSPAPAEMVMASAQQPPQQDPMALLKAAWPAFQGWVAGFQHLIIPRKMVNNPFASRYQSAGSTDGAAAEGEELSAEEMSAVRQLFKPVHERDWVF